MIRLNLLTGKSGHSAEKPVELTEADFWEYYMKLLNVRNNFSLTEKELKVMAYILTQGWERSQFKGNEGKLLRETFKMKRPDLSKIKNQLIIKGYIQDTGEARGDALPVSAIRNFQIHVKRLIALKAPVLIDFTFPLEIV